MFTEGADLSNSGFYDEGRLRLAVLDTASWGVVAARDLLPTDSTSRTQPGIARVGASTAIAWHERTNSGAGALFTKELVWDPVGRVLDFSRPVARLPRGTEPGDRRDPAIASTGAHALISVWSDTTRVFGSSQQRGDIVVAGMSVPFERLP